tara:strand:+ start:65 stop:721 length:657 start_codon:yes stop_codon:yes gene_type:complete
MAEKKPLRIVAFGDSITYGNGSSDKSGYIIKLENKLREHLKQPKLKVINRGLNAESTDWAIQRFARVIEEEEPDIMLIMEGLNDVVLHKKDDPVENLRKMIQICKQKNVKPYLATILPMKPRFTASGRFLLSTANFINSKKPVRIKPNSYYDNKIAKTNERIKKMAKEEGVECIDAHTHFVNLDLNLVLNDTVHPNDQGYEELSELWFETLRKNSNKN